MKTAGRYLLVRRIGAGPVDELLYSASNLVLTGAALLTSTSREFGQFSVHLALVLLVGGWARGAIGERLAVDTAAGALLIAERRRVLLVLGLQAVAWAVLAAVLSLSAQWDVPPAVWLLYIGVGLNGWFAVGRSAIQSGGQASLTGLLANVTWLVVQGTMMLALYFANSLTLTSAAASWLAGLAIACATLAFVEMGEPFTYSLAQSRLHSPLRYMYRVDSYSLEAALAQVGPQLVILAAAIFLSLNEVGGLRVVIVFAGPVALIGSGLRHVLVGHYSAANTTSFGAIAKTSGYTLAASTVAALFTAPVLWWLARLGPGTETDPGEVIRLAAITAFLLGRALGTAAQVPASYMRVFCSGTFFLSLRIATLGLSTGGVMVGAYVSGVNGALLCVGAGMVLSSAMYFAAAWWKSSSERDTGRGPVRH